MLQGLSPRPSFGGFGLRLGKKGSTSDWSSTIPGKSSLVMEGAVVID